MVQNCGGAGTIGLEMMKYIHKEHTQFHAYYISEVDSSAFISYVNPKAFFTFLSSNGN